MNNGTLNEGFDFPTLSKRENAIAEVLKRHYLSSPNKWIAARDLAWSVNALMDEPYTDLTYTGVDKYAGVDRYDFRYMNKDGLSIGNFKQYIGNLLSMEIHEMNQSGVLPFLIISDRHKGYKLADPTELKAFLNRSWDEVSNKAIYLKQLETRAKQSGQIYLDGSEKPVFIGRFA